MGELDRRPVAPIAETLAREDWPVLVALPVVASVFVFAAPRLGWWAFALAGLVYAAGFVAFDRMRATERTLNQLVVALGRIPEFGGSPTTGRSERVASLAEAVARRLDLKPQLVADVVAAARCGEVGRLGHEDWPHLRLGFDDRAAARWSASILQQVPKLQRIAQLVGPAPLASTDAARLRAIVDLVTAYDDAMYIGGLDATAALEKVAETGRADVVAAIAAIGDEPG